MRHIISVLMENEPGALSRVVGLFSQRNYNIDSLTVAPTEDTSLSRLTLTTTGDDARIEQITKHLNKLVDVVKLVDLTEGAHIERELMLIKIKASGTQRSEVKRVADTFFAYTSRFLGKLDVFGSYCFFHRGHMHSKFFANHLYRMGSNRFISSDQFCVICPKII